MRLPFGKSRLRKAIESGLANGQIGKELKELGDLTLKSSADAEDVCWGVQQLNSESKQLGQQTDSLARLFQEVDGRDCPAFQMLQEHGVAELLRLFDQIIKSPKGDDTNTLLFILKILGLYGTVAGTLKVVEAARRPLKPSDFMWSIILRNFTTGHPEKELLYDSLREPLPEGFIAVSFLDAANALLIAGDSMLHPFDTAEGKQRLRQWLSDPDPEEFSYAHSATAALPFISQPERDELLDLALNHPDSGVQVEAAWAAAKIGRKDGLQLLAKHCLNFKTAEASKRYLSDLGREDVIPAKANDAGFAAMAEFAQWLSHPNELGCAPDELEIVDHRELRWPPERKQKPLWLIKYQLRDTTGLEEDAVECGLVGSVTFCFFSYQLAHRPPEDAYAVHCYWEVEQKSLIEESNVEDDPGDYDNLFRQWNGTSIDNRQMRFIAELSPELGYSQRLVGLASGSLNGEKGWVVLDGPRSEWYPRSEQPPDVYESVVLKIHIGRHLLGFTVKPDRRRFLVPSPPPKPPDHIIIAYEKLLGDARNAKETRRKEAFRSFGPIGKHFDQYVDALHITGRDDYVRQLVKDISPHWDHPSGYSKLGNAAYKSGHLDLAEEFFLKIRDRYTNYERGEEMGLLAEMWFRRGKHDAAKDLMLDCLRRLFEESKTVTGSDKTLFEEWFQTQRTAFLKLFPNEGEAILASQSIPTSARQGQDSGSHRQDL